MTGPDPRPRWSPGCDRLMVDAGAIPCPHTRSTMVAARGIGGWRPVEEYACDDCGHHFEVPVPTSNS